MSESAFQRDYLEGGQSPPPKEQSAFVRDYREDVPPGARQSGTFGKPLNLDFHAYNDHVWVSGFGDSGKTKFVQYALLPYFLNNGLVVVIYDYAHNYGLLGLPATARPSILTDCLQNRESIIYQSDTNRPEDFINFCITVRHFQRIVIVFEEIHEFIKSYHTMPPDLNMIVKSGRNFHRSYVCVTQRPQEIPKAFLTNAIHRFYFQQDYESPPDKKWLQSAIGETADRLMAAEPYSFVYKRRGPRYAPELHAPIPPSWLKNPRIV